MAQLEPIVVGNGQIVNVRLADDIELPSTSDDIGSVGALDHLRLDEVMAVVRQAASTTKSALAPAKPSKAKLELGIGFTAGTGKALSFFLVDAEADATLKVVIEWDFGGADGQT